MACCVLAAFIITHVWIFIQKGVSVLLFPFGVQMKSGDTVSGVQWSAYSSAQRETPSAQLYGSPRISQKKKNTQIMSWRKQAEKKTTVFHIEALRWGAISLVIIEVAALGILGHHFSQHGASMVAMF